MLHLKILTGYSAKIGPVKGERVNLGQVLRLSNRLGLGISKNASFS